MQPKNRDFAKEYALFRLRHDDSDGAIETLRPLLLEQPRIVDVILFAELLSQRNRDGDRNEAISALDAVADSISRVPETERLEYLDLRCYLLSQSNRNDDAKALIEDGIPSDFISDGAMLAVRANLLRRAGEYEAAIQMARKAIAQLNPGSPESDCTFVAQSLASLKLYAEALTIWKGFLKATSFERPHEVALECARRCGDDKFVVDFSDSLRTNGVAPPSVIELEVVTLEKYNELDKACEVIETYLACPTDETLARMFRVRLSLIGRRLSKAHLIEYDVARLPNVHTVSPDLGAAVAQILREGPNQIDGVNYAYELVRRNFDSPAAHKALVAAVGLGDDHEVQLPEYETVELGCAVKFREDGSSDDRWLILEDSVEPEISRGEIAPNSTIGSELIGKKIGDTFYVRRDSVQNRTATILAIVSKFAYRYHDSMDEWEMRFPDEFFVKKYDLGKTETSEPDLTTIFKSLDEQAAHADVLHRLYKEQPISMTSFAKFANVSVIESLSHLSTQRELPIRCCRGSDEEFRALAEAVREKVTLVLDPAALATLYMTGLFKQVDTFPLSCVVSIGTIEEIRHRLLGNYGVARSRRRIGKEGSKYVFSERTVDDIREGTESVETFLCWVGKIATKVGGLALAGIDEGKRVQLIQFFGQPTAECIALATQVGYVLWTDDFAVAEIANSELNVRRVWSQGLFECLVAQDSMAVEILNDFSLQLVTMGFEFTRLMPDVGIEAARKAKWDPVQSPLIEIVKWFRSSGVKPEGAVGLMAAILVAIWREAPLVDQRERVTKALAESIAERPDGSVILRVFVKNAQRIFGVDVLNAERCARVVRLVIDLGGHGGGLILPDTNGP